MKIDEIINEPIVIDRPPVLKPNDEEKTAQPPMFAAVLHNDDYTPANFVSDILEKHFNKGLGDAWNLMIYVHKHGKAPIAIYPRDVAESKVLRANSEAQAAGHPLRLTVEPV